MFRPILLITLERWGAVGSGASLAADAERARWWRDRLEPGASPADPSR